MVIIGGICAGLGWVGSGRAETVTALYLSYALSGLGAGVVYGTAIGSALKWFPDHRGLAAGLTAAGFGAGSALTVSPIANLINTAGYQTAFIRWGIIQGTVVVIAALGISLKGESDGADLVGEASVSVEDLGRRDGWYWARATIGLVLRDPGSARVIVSVNESAREAARLQPEAGRRVLHAVSEKLRRSVPAAFMAWADAP